MSRKSYDISKRHWVWVRATSHKTGDVRDVKHHHRADFVGNFLERFWF
jgi:hypothetical protein